MARAHARLLGPCFKTGPASARNKIIADRDARGRRLTPPTDASRSGDRTRAGTSTRTPRGRARRALGARALLVSIPSGRPPALAGPNRCYAARATSRRSDGRPAGRDALLREKCTPPRGRWSDATKRPRPKPPPSAARPHPARWRWISPFVHSSFAGLPLDGFTYSWTLSSKFFSTFPHGTCSLSVSRSYLALDGVYHPLWAALSSNPTLGRRSSQRRRLSLRAWHPLRVNGPVQDELGRGERRKESGPSRTPHLPAAEKAAGFGAGLFPVRSPLLRKSWLVSFPPLTNMLKFGG